ncbi:MAG: hypothetical protein P8Y18_04700 [Candidatus Bathyarchaeota archaeon]
MSENKYPICPICKKEVLLPFSIMQVAVEHPAEKTYGNWICSNCGFFLTTRDTRAINPEKDIESGFNLDLQQKVEDLRKEYYKRAEK